MDRLENPFAAHIDSCDNDPEKIQRLYIGTRTERATFEKEKVLAGDFQGWRIDPILAKLDGPDRNPSFEDPRHSIVVCASPPDHVKQVIREIQLMLKKAAPNIWLAPHENLHITTLDIASSKTEDEIEEILSYLSPAFPELAKCTVHHHPRLIKPRLNFDSAALAISFVPASCEGVEPDRDGTYTYHHLRRDVYSIVAATTAEISPRYLVPSAHVTVARFITQDGFLQSEGNEIDRAKVKNMVARIDKINQWLRTEYWPRDGSIPLGGEWVVGKDKGLECRKGRIWYGGGEDVLAKHNSQQPN